MDIEIAFGGGKKINANINGKTIFTDQPVKVGGEDSAPTPFELFLASLGTCAGIFVKSFCDQRNIPTDNIKIIEHLEFNPIDHMVSKVGIEIKIPDDFPEKYRDAMINVADLCTVKKHLLKPPAMEVYTTK